MHSSDFAADEGIFWDYSRHAVQTSTVIKINELTPNGNFFSLKASHSVGMNEEGFCINHLDSLSINVNHCRNLRQS